MVQLGFSLSFFYYIYETLDHANYCVRSHCLPSTLDRRGRKIIATRPNYADGGNQTRAASTATESAIHYTIPFRLVIKNSQLKFMSYYKSGLYNDILLTTYKL